VANFWEKAKEKIIKEPLPKEEVVNLQEKLSKLELSDINYLYEMMTERTYRGREMEQATTTYLKIKFIKAMLESEAGGLSGKEEIKDS